MESDEQPTNTYVIRPEYHHKFKAAVVQEIIQKVLKLMLEGKEYTSEDSLEWCQEISDKIKDEVKAQCQLDRYKIVVQTVIGEQRGGGAKMACRCLWDSDTDNYAQGVYTNKSLFCVAAAYGIYYY